MIAEQNNNSMYAAVCLRKVIDKLLNSSILVNCINVNLLNRTYSIGNDKIRLINNLHVAFNGSSGIKYEIILNDYKLGEAFYPHDNSSGFTETDIDNRSKLFSLLKNIEYFEQTAEELFVF